jgi:hypothetical protein
MSRRVLKFFIRVEWVSGKRIIKVERVLGIALIIRVIHNHGSQRVKGPMLIYQPPLSKNQRTCSGMLTMVLNFLKKHITTYKTSKRGSFMKIINFFFFEITETDGFSIIYLFFNTRTSNFSHLKYSKNQKLTIINRAKYHPTWFFYHGARCKCQFTKGQLS